MFNDYKRLDHLRLPQEVRKLLIRLEYGGIISPVIYGGAIRDLITKYKKINDYDVYCAGIEESSKQQIIKNLLDTAPTKTSLIKILIPEDIESYFINKLGIKLTKGMLIQNSIKFLGNFVDNDSSNIPPIDF